MVGKWLGMTLGLAFIIFGLSAWPDARRAISGLRPAKTPTSGYSRADVAFSDFTVHAEVPETTALQAKGLAGRTGMKDSEGMLWLYDQSDYYAFWMKGMAIPLDFIWMDKSKIVDLTANVAPPGPGQTDFPVYRPAQAADAVLEVRAGFIKDHSLEVGEAVTVDRR